jgi:hypothetical protein
MKRDFGLMKTVPVIIVQYPVRKELEVEVSPHVTM